MYSDTFLKKMKKPEMLRDLWNRRTMNKIGNIWKARLVPLNKKWPDVPDRKDFRPIVVLSAMYKFLDLRFLPKLKKYMT